MIELWFVFFSCLLKGESTLEYESYTGGNSCYCYYGYYSFYLVVTINEPLMVPTSTSSG